MKKTVLFIIFMLLLVPAYAQENMSHDELLSAKTIRYYLGQGTSPKEGTLGMNAKLETHPWSSDPKDSMMTIDSINIKEGTARLIGNAGAEDLIVLISSSGLNFIERTPSGNINLTTIFSTKIKGTNKYPVVESRHIGTSWTPMPSQYYGEAEILETN